MPMNIKIKSDTNNENENFSMIKTPSLVHDEETIEFMSEMPT